MNVDFQRRMQRAALLAVAGTSAASVIYTRALSYFYTTPPRRPYPPRTPPAKIPPIFRIQPTSSVLVSIRNVRCRVEGR